MASYIKPAKTPDANATSFELLEKTAEGAYTSLEEKNEINFEVSALGLAEGDHILVVKAKADGYEDSDPSNEVVYTVPKAGWVDITDQFKFVEGRMVSAQNGNVSTWDGWVANDEYVDLSAYSEIEIKMSKTSSTATGTGLAFYDADKKFVSGIPHTDGVATYGTMIKTITLESNMKYVRTTYWSTANGNYVAEYGEFYCKAKPKN